MTKPINPDTVLGADTATLPAYLSNGVIGLRVRPMPLAAGMALLSGYTGRHPERQIEAAAAAPYPLAGDIALDGVWLSDAPHLVRALRQDYDFSTGELTSRFEFHASGRVASVEVVAFCCRQDPTLVCQEIAVTVDTAVTLGLCAIIDAGGADGRVLTHDRATPGENAPAIDGSLLWESAGGLSTCGLAVVTELTGGGDERPARPPLRDHRLVSRYEVRARAGRPVRLRQMVSVVANVLHAMPDQQASRLAAKARFDGFPTLRRRNREAWQELWKGRIRLEGASEDWQALSDAAVFYLLCSVHASSPASTSIFGLATWRDYHYYFGHVMWDIEAFAVPSLNLLAPHAARALLDYRSDHLAGARRNAQIMGRLGLQFPWESAPGTGEESAPLPATAAWHEDHVSLDVARAFTLHADVTGDEQFLRERAWPVLRGVCQWLTSRVDKVSDGYVIAASMGIAERKQPVDNAAFTAMAAVVVLRDAIRTAQTLGLTPDPQWADIAQRLHVPRRGSAIISHDGYRVDEEKGATPDPLMGLFPFGYAMSPPEERQTLALYLSLAQDYIGSPMLSALYGAWAARNGDRRLALRLLDEGYGQFSAERFSQPLEYRADRFPEQPRAGPFFANIGGFLTSLLFGFTGVEPGPEDPSAWARRPVNLPAGWTAISVERVFVRGQPMHLEARQGEMATLTPL